jgi:hypothetical protein
VTRDPTPTLKPAQGARAAGALQARQTRTSKRCTADRPDPLDPALDQRAAKAIRLSGRLARSTPRARLEEFDPSIDSLGEVHAKTKGPADATANPLISHWARQASNLGPTGYEPAALTN